MNERSIQYDRETKDFRAELNGEVVGYFKSYIEAEEALDALVYEQLTHGVEVA